MHRHLMSKKQYAKYSAGRDDDFDCEYCGETIGLKSKAKHQRSKACKAYQ